MSEPAGVKHVKRNCVWMPARVLVKSKLRLRINVAQDQPCRSDAIDSRMGPREPGPSNVVFGSVLSSAAFGWAAATFELAYSFFDARAYRTPKEINLNNLLQASLQARKPGLRVPLISRL